MLYYRSTPQGQSILGRKLELRANLFTRVAPFFSIIAVLWFSLLNPVAAQDQTPTQVYLQNVPVQDEKLLVVNIVLAEIHDLYGAEVQLRYDPAQMKVRDENSRLEGVQITPGPLLASDARFVATNRADLESGQIDFVFTLLKPATPLQGDGTLATIAFEILDAGPYLIEVSRVQLVSSQLKASPFTTENLYLNGDLQRITQPQYLIATQTAWEGWRTLALISLMLALLLLVLMRSRWVVATLAGRNGSQPGPQRVTNSARSSLRSSALLSEQGHHALSQNDTEKAYELFSQAIELDPANAKAWLGRGLVAQQRMEKLICFQRVLALDPNNRRARLELNQLSTSDAGSK